MATWLLVLALASSNPVATGLGATPADAHFAWPHGAHAAVSLSYDDALASQLDNAIPALDKAGLKATFYPTLSSDVLRRRMPEWRAAAARGHELGNHTLFHQCSRSVPGHDWVTADNDLDHTTVGQLAAQIRVGNAMLHAIDGRDRRTFTVPCGDFLAAGQPYLPEIAKDFVAIKAGEGGVIADMAMLDVHHVGVTAPSDVTGAQLIALVQQAEARGTMINFTFHGIGGDYLTVSNKAHDELLAYLAAHRDRIWTDTFLDLMTYVSAEQARIAVTPAAGRPAAGRPEARTPQEPRPPADPRTPDAARR